jgi:hypothetical protein
MFRAGDLVEMVTDHGGFKKGEQGTVYFVDQPAGKASVEFDYGSFKITASIPFIFIKPHVPNLTLTGSGPGWLGTWGEQPEPVSDYQKKTWKDEGRCQECGTLLPISIWGLGECPNHPKPVGKQ